jgi:hypothetical protein
MLEEFEVSLLLLALPTTWHDPKQLSSISQIHNCLSSAVIPQYLSPCSKSKEEASILILLTLFLNNIKMEFRERGWISGVRGTKLSGSSDELF